jgi:hypothetical protein
MEWMDGWTNEWVNEWMSEWVNEWMSEWVNEWMSEWMNVTVHLFWQIKSDWDRKCLTSTVSSSALNATLSGGGDEIWEEADKFDAETFKKIKFIDQ